MVWSNQTDPVRLFVTRVDSEKPSVWHGAKGYIGEQPPGWYLEFIASREYYNIKNDSILLRDLKFFNCAIKQRDDESCKKGQFTCQSGACIPDSQV